MVGVPLQYFLARHLFVAVILVIGGVGYGTADGANDRLLGEKKMVSLHHLQWGEESMAHAKPTPHQSLGKHNTKSTVLELKHHTLSSVSSSSHEAYLHNLFNSDNARTTTIQTAIQNHNSLYMQSSNQAQVPISSGAQLQTLNYVTTITLGTTTNLTLIVDTGSDLTWVQCKPCFACYNQQDPLFDPSGSQTYTSVQCNSTACVNSLRAATGRPGFCSTDNASCYYMVSYGDGSYTRGILAKESIGLGNANVENFTFGCGQSNRGLFGGTSGLMGLGRSELSLVSQTSDQFGGVFSYCLPSRMYNSSGSLVLGNDTSVYKNTTPISYTRMIADPSQPPFYFLNLTGARVGNVELQAPGFGNGEVLIDSGTVITRLVPSVYKALKAEFTRQFAEYPPAPAFSILDTCFNLSGVQEVSVPMLKLEFEGGVDMSVDASGVFYFVKKDGSQVCLAFASLAAYADQVGIIGNYQQKNKRVVYDTAGSRLGFAEEDCSYGLN